LPQAVCASSTPSRSPTWQNRERWLNKYAADEEERLFAAFNEYSEHLVAVCRTCCTPEAPPHVSEPESKTCAPTIYVILWRLAWSSAAFIIT
jgi:hypothetical protein